MHHPCLDFFRAAFVPEIFAQVPAGAADDGQEITVFVVAIRAFPFVVVIADDFAVEAADVAVVGFRIEFAVADVVVDETDHREDGFDIVCHIRDFDVGNAAAGRDFLELRLEAEFIEDVDRLTDIHVVAIRVVAFVGHVGDVAEAGAIEDTETVREGFGRGAVEGKAEAVFFSPVDDGLFQAADDPERKFFAFRGRVGDTFDEDGGFVNADVAEGKRRVSVLQKVENFRAFRQACDGAVLPMYGGYVARDVFQKIVAKEERLVAELETFIENLEKFLFVAACQNADLREIERDDAHIETAVPDVVSVFIFPRGEEGAATHRAEDVSFINLTHFLRGNIIGIHAFGGAFRGELRQVIVGAARLHIVLVQDVNELRESRCHVDVLLVFDALPALLEDFFVDHCRFFRVFEIRREIHEERHERRLAVRRHERIDLVLDGLDAVFDLFARPFPRDFFGFFHIGLNAVDFLLFLEDARQNFIVGFPDVGRQNPVDAVDALAAVLAAGDLRDDLRRHGASDLEGFRRVDFFAVDDGSIRQHVFQIDEAAVEHRLNDVVHVVEMDRAAVVRLDDIEGNELAAGDVFGHFAGDEIALGRDDLRIFIGIFVHDFHICLADEADDVFVRRIDVALESLHRFVIFVRTRRRRIVVFQKFVVDLIFDGINRHGMAEIFGIFFDLVGDFLRYAFLVNAARAVHGRFDGRRDFFLLKRDFFPVALNDFHTSFFLPETKYFPQKPTEKKQQCKKPEQRLRCISGNTGCVCRRK